MDQHEIQRTLDETLVDSFRTHDWHSDRGRSHWVELEGWQDAMAGPLSSIGQEAGCAYVYPRNDAWFKDVHNPTSLEEYLQSNLRGLRRGVERFEPRDEGEQADLEYMLSIVERLSPVIESALAIEHARWLTAKN